MRTPKLRPKVGPDARLTSRAMNPTAVCTKQKDPSAFSGKNIHVHYATL